MKLVGAIGRGLVLCTLVFGSGCSKDKDQEKANASRPSEQNKKRVANLDAPEMFKRIPANSPMVFANYEPWDDDFVSGLADTFAPMAKVLKKQFNKEIGDHPDAQRFLAEHGDLFSIAGLEKIGFDTTPHFAMYMHDLSFVTRIELRDGQALLNFGEKLVKDYGKGKHKQIESKTIGTVHYWETPDKDIDLATAIIAIDSGELVFAIVPTALKAKLIPEILGTKLPAKSIADTGALKAVVADYGGVKGAGYINSLAAVDLLMSGTSELRGTDFDLSSISPVCKQEVKEMAGLMPMVTFGYGNANENLLSMFYGIELRKDVAAKFAEVMQPVPGYGQFKDSKATMTFGMGFNFGGLLSWFRELSQEIQTSPYKCEHFLELNEGLANMADGIAKAPPILGDLGGFIMVLDTFTPDNPMSMTGMAAIAAKEPGALLSLASSAMPGGPLKLEAGAAPKKLDLGALGVPVDIYAAQGKTMLGVAVGSAKDRLKQLVDTSIPSSGPFMTMSYDYSTIMELVEKSVMDDASDNPELMAAVMSMFGALGTLTFDMENTTSGVVARYTLDVSK